MRTFTSHSPEETRKIGRDFADKVSSGVIILSGDLGSGKTIFVQGFARGLGIKEKIISPTYVLIKQYKISRSKILTSEIDVFYHVDLYRLEKEVDLENLGLQELFDYPKNLIIIEWGEKIKKLPQNSIHISFKSKEQEREIKIDSPS